MESTFTRALLEERLTANRLDYGVLELQDGASALIVERGGRLLGPFWDTQSPSLSWINPVVSDEAAFAQFLADGEWNLGGERIWLSPEIQFLVRDRSDFWGTMSVPQKYDPGRWWMDQTANGHWRLREQVALKLYNLASGRKEIAVRRTFRPVADPLTNSGQYARLLDGVRYAGYEQMVMLEEQKVDGVSLQTWNVLELNAGGQLLIPCTPGIHVTSYFGEPDAAHMHWWDRALCIRLTGKRLFKVGLRAAHHFGRLAYFNMGADGNASLIVRQFFNNPSSPYTDEPAHTPGARGDSLHVFNDGGDFGGYGEMEVQGQTVGGEGGVSAARDPQILWCYEGPRERIHAISHHLLGIEPSREW